MSDLPWRSAKHLGTGARGHPRGRASLGLTTAFGAGKRGPFRHDGADETGAGEGVNDPIIAQTLRVRDAREHGGQHAGSARGRRGDNDTHRGVHLLHREGAHQHVAKERAGERPWRPALEFCRITANEARRRKQIAGFTFSNGVAHDVQRASELCPNISDRAAGVLGLGTQRDRRQGRLFCFCRGDRGAQ